MAENSSIERCSWLSCYLTHITHKPAKAEQYYLPRKCRQGHIQQTAPEVHCYKGNHGRHIVSDILLSHPASRITGLRIYRICKIKRTKYANRIQSNNSTFYLHKLHLWNFKSSHSKAAKKIRNNGRLSPL